MERLRVDELDFDFIKEVISGLINKKVDLAKANKPDDKEITKYFTFVTNEKPFTYHQITAWLLSAINQKTNSINIKKGLDFLFSLFLILINAKTENHLCFFY